MKRYLIKEAFNLQSANMKLVRIGQYIATEDPQVAEELARFAAQGSCEEVKSKPKPKEAPKEEAKPTIDPNDDISLVKGIGAGTEKKLAEAGITTKSALQAAILDAAREEEMKGIFGAGYGKIRKQFVPVEGDTPSE